MYEGVNHCKDSIECNLYFTVFTVNRGNIVMHLGRIIKLYIIVLESFEEFLPGSQYASTTSNFCVVLNLRLLVSICKFFMENLRLQALFICNNINYSSEFANGVISVYLYENQNSRSISCHNDSTTTTFRWLFPVNSNTD